jgi:predicted metal-binding membrane protein
MPMMSPMMSPTMSAAMTALMTVAMMVAMMLPSLAPTAWRYHHNLRAVRTLLAAQRTALFAAGYAGVWATIGLALFVISAELSAMGTASPAHPSFATWSAGAVVLCVGAIQRSRWKARQLLRCRQACVPDAAVSNNAVTAWRAGCRLGVDCCLSCAAPMAVLFTVGLMDGRMMTLITAAITAERVAPAGARIARLTGALALIAGLVICLRAVDVTMSAAA